MAEEARLLDMRAGLDLAEAEGYQQMAADAEKARAANIEQGILRLRQPRYDEHAEHAPVWLWGWIKEYAI